MAANTKTATLAPDCPIESFPAGEGRGVVPPGTIRVEPATEQEPKKPSISPGPPTFSGGSRHGRKARPCWVCSGPRVGNLHLLWCGREGTRSHQKPVCQACKDAVLAFRISYAELRARLGPDRGAPAVWTLMAPRYGLIAIARSPGGSLFDDILSTPGVPA
jgi:hypothetical protein